MEKVRIKMNSATAKATDISLLFTRLTSVNIDFLGIILQISVVVKASISRLFDQQLPNELAQKFGREDQERGE